MRFCMVTSFFGEHSFGGDSVYVERLCQALLRSGHEVHVAYCPGAYESIRGDTSQREYTPPGDLVLHPLNDAGMKGIMDALWSHQTGRPGRFYARLEALLRQSSFDVVHFHNISLMGGGKLLQLACKKSGAHTILTMHDYWWICPQSLLWKFGRMACDAPECAMCNIRRRVPPQFWRQKGCCDEALSELDIVLFSSQSACQIYRNNGFEHSGTRILPGIIPEEWHENTVSATSTKENMGGRRPYLAAAGRLVSEKGFQTLLPLMRNFPDMDLVIAGDGPLRSELTMISRELKNVRFLGLISSEEIRYLFQGACAVVIPSLFPETFGLVAAEAISLNIPVIARRSGSLPELISAAGGGELYENEKDLLSILKKIGEQNSTSNNCDSFLGSNPPDVWFENRHVERYLEIINESLNQGER